MSKATGYFGGSSVEDEQALSLEERNKIYARGMREFGFLKEDRLAGAAEVPGHESLELSYSDGTVRIGTRKARIRAGTSQGAVPRTMEMPRMGRNRK